MESDEFLISFVELLDTSAGSVSLTLLDEEDFSELDDTSSCPSALLKNSVSIFYVDTYSADVGNHDKNAFRSIRCIKDED